MEDFEKCASYVLNRLYEDFPRPVKFHTYSMQDDQENKTLYHYGDRTEPNETESRIDEAIRNYSWTLSFLVFEGIIRDIERENLKHVVDYAGSKVRAPRASSLGGSYALTAKGLSILNATPTVLNGEANSIIEKLRAGVKKQSSEIVTEAIKSVVSLSVSAGASIIS